MRWLLVLLLLGVLATLALARPQEDVVGGEEECTCVPYYQCQNGSVIQNGAGLIDIRVRGSCESYLDECCQQPGRISPTAGPYVKQSCGMRHPDGVGFRITGDENNEAQFGEFPWMVAVLREENSEGRRQYMYQCGGSLIHPQIVLTGAHCVDGKSAPTLKIRAGEWDTQTSNEILPYQDRNVGKVIIHEKYVKDVLYYDVALLYLEEPVDLAENVDVVCLPAQGEVFHDSRCFASGWGKDVFGKDGRYQVILKKVELPVVPRDDCIESLRKTRLGSLFQLHETFMCAGGERGIDTCSGDGGSPLVCPLASDPTRYRQAGIVAWGIGCGDNTPGVYANVALFREWIDQQMLYNNLDSTTYQY